MSFESSIAPRRHLTRLAPLLLPLLLTGCNDQAARDFERFLLGLLLIGLMVAVVVVVVGLTLLVLLLVLAYFAHKKSASVGTLASYALFTLLLCVGWVGMGVLAQGITLYSSVLPVIAFASAVRLLLARNFPDKPVVSWGGVGAVVLSWLSLAIAVPLLMPRPALFDELASPPPEPAWVQDDWMSEDAGPSEPVNDSPMVQASVGFSHVCGVRADGTVACAGANWEGQLGIDDDDFRSHATVPGIEGARLVGIGGDFSCALLHDGEMRCWGVQSHAASPQRGHWLLPGGSDVTDFVMSRDQVYMIHTGGRLEGWPRPVPSQVQGEVVSVAVDRSGDTCTAMRSGEVWCWSDHRAPRRKPVTDAVDVSQVFFGACVLNRAGEVRCEDISRFRDVELPAPAVELANGSGEVCARLQDHRVFCWRDSGSGFSAMEIGSLSGANDLRSGEAVCGTFDGRPPVCVEGMRIVERLNEL